MLNSTYNMDLLYDRIPSEVHDYRAQAVANGQKYSFKGLKGTKGLKTFQEIKNTS